MIGILGESASATRGAWANLIRPVSPVEWQPAEVVQDVTLDLTGAQESSCCPSFEHVQAVIPTIYRCAQKRVSGTVNGQNFNPLGELQWMSVRPRPSIRLAR